MLLLLAEVQEVAEVEVVEVVDPMMKILKRKLIVPVYLAALH